MCGDHLCSVFELSLWKAGSSFWRIAGCDFALGTANVWMDEFFDFFLDDRNYFTTTTLGLCAGSTVLKLSFAMHLYFICPCQEGRSVAVRHMTHIQQLNFAAELGHILHTREHTDSGNKSTIFWFYTPNFSSYDERISKNRQYHLPISTVHSLPYPRLAFHNRLS